MRGRTREELLEITEQVFQDPVRRVMSQTVQDTISWARFNDLGDWEQARLTAHALHEKGYRLPKVITTAEELDALPVGTIVRATSNLPWTATVFEKASTGGSRTWVSITYSARYSETTSVDSGELLRPFNDLAATATVIFEPEEVQA